MPSPDLAFPPDLPSIARAFLTPARAAPDEGARRLLAAGERLDLSFTSRGRGVAAWAWGAAGPTVLLVHGWSSAAWQLGAFVEPLVRHGFRVAAFDAPAHGASPGTTTSAVEMSEVVLAAGRLLGPLHAAIGHSAGAAAIARAATRGLVAGRLVLVSPWTRARSWVERYAAGLALPRVTAARLVAAVEAEAGAPLASVDVAALAPDLAAPTLVVHDADDALVALDDVRAAAARLPRGALVETRGLGHARVLRAREVVEAVVQFVGRPSETAACREEEMR